MNNEIASILQGYLSIEEDVLRHVMLDILELCKSERGASEAIVRLEAMLDDYSSGLELLDKVPLYSIFLAYAQYKWGRLPNSVKSISNAIQGFEQLNGVRNNVIALWMRALIHRESGHIDAARQDITNGIELIERELGDSKRTSHYNECRDCEIIHSRMLELRNSLDIGFPKRTSNSVATGFAPHSGDPKQSSSSKGPGLYLSFPIYTVRAGLEGEIAYESAPFGEVIIETVIINGKTHQIHSLREWSEVVMRPAVYRWLQVQGDSMENASPISILEGDCVLVIDISKGDYKPRYGDIVVATKHTDIGSEGAALIKRFMRDGLCAESNTIYPPISLKNVSLRGLAIAVAKLVK